MTKINKIWKEVISYGNKKRRNWAYSKFKYD